MSYKNYKQADSRWGSKNYNGSSTMAAAGCGPTACAIIISKINPKITPVDTMKYMQTHGDAKHKTFALYGQGTAWNGIKACLAHFGCQDAHEVNVNTSMSEVWKQMKKGYVGVFLFDGMPWTTQGHYVAVTGYKYENGKHYVYTRDPGSRNRTGWYAYETTMRGRVPKVWLCKAVVEKPKDPPKDKPAADTPQEPKTVDIRGLKKVVDISYWQSDVDLKKAKKAGVDGVIIRTSYTSQSKFSLNKDSRFISHLKKAIEAGLPIGVYHYSQAISEAEAKKEAAYMLDIIQPYKKHITLPVVMDYEFGGRLSSTSAKKLGKAGVDKVITAFCEQVIKAGYTAMVYANYSTFTNYLNYQTIRRRFLIWLAQYASKPSITDYDLWQYTSKAKISGIGGNVDVSKGSGKAPAAPKTYRCNLPDWTLLSGNIIAQTAKELAWKKGTKKEKYTYKIGHPTEAFKAAIDKVFPNRKSWSKQCQEGASCDVGAAVIIRASGADPKIPRGLAKQFPYMKKSKRFKEINIKEGYDFHPGDMGLWLTNSAGHAWIHVASKTIAEANHTAKYFLHLDSDNYTAKGRKEFHCYRICVPIREYIQRGDRGSEVKKLQKYLNWYGGYGLKLDSYCGPATTAAIEKYQAAEGLKVDGKFGAKSLERARKVKR